MSCVYCNYQNAGENKFCENCGRPLVIQKHVIQQVEPIVKKATESHFSLLVTGVIVIILGGIIGVILAVIFDIWGLNDVGFAIGVIVQVIGGAMTLPWLYTGFMGGVTLTTKKIRGTNWWIWIFLFGLIPLIIWLMFLVFMALLGTKSNQIAQNALPTKKRCQECQGWNDYAATRCTHCGQPINL